MKRNKLISFAVMTGVIACLVPAFSARVDAADTDEWKDENVVIEEDPGGSGNGALPDLLDSGDARRFLQLADNLGRNSHSFGGSYAHVPAPGWRNDRYEGFQRNSFVIGSSYRLGTNLSYDQSNSFRDRNFPGTLYGATAGVSFSGDRFFSYAGAANRSDRLFGSFDDVTINAGAIGTPYRSGPHGLVIGGIFSLRGEIWKYPVPLPVIAYRFVSRTMVILAGLPFFMAWKPNKWFTLSLYGFLPGVGRAAFIFKVADFCTITLDYAHRKESYHLNEYPFHDWRSAEHWLRRMAGRDDMKGRFIAESNETGVRFTFRPVDEVTLYAYTGFRFRSMYYFSENILARPKSADRQANSASVKAGAVFLFHSGGGTEVPVLPEEKH